MATPTDERRDLLTVIVHMRAKPGREDELLDGDLNLTRLQRIA